MEAGAGSGTSGVRSSWRGRVPVPSPAPLALLRRAGAGAQGRASAALGALRAQWNRSLQLRVVGTTLIFSAVVIATLGFFLLQQIASGLVQNKERSAATLAADGVQVAENQLALKPGVTPASPAAGGLMYDILQTLPQERNAGAATGVAMMINTARGQGRHRARLQPGPVPDGRHPAAPDRAGAGRPAEQRHRGHLRADHAEPGRRQRPCPGWPSAPRSAMTTSCTTCSR